MDLKLPMLDASLSGRPLSINKTYYEAYLKKSGLKLNFKDSNTFWVPVKGTDDKGKQVENGQVRIQIDIYPKNQ